MPPGGPCCHRKLDILTDSAGLFLSADIATLKTDDLDRLLAVNVRAAVIGIQAAAAAMKDGGRIGLREPCWDLPALLRN